MILMKSCCLVFADAETQLKAREAQKVKKAKVAKMLAEIYGVCRQF